MSENDNKFRITLLFRELLKSINGINHCLYLRLGQLFI